ncbi:DNA topoisomerase IB [Cyclobacterium sp.]|uniref:DNA topoisomerase IB n=1 Tax=Cyclobacterium sp. TaxID=1966343 RepID=UPI0019CB69EE|nr:DNA topoisomerase IB [Cyclobacterium sp.]MBD3629006.1 DNA topoisomerase IB [Cyclobacterium sp.]
MDYKVKHIDEDSLCLQRKKKGNGYIYLNGNGEKITHPKQIRRIKNLVIPPMWTEVCICKYEDGHIQATGRDLKGRKQYIYHSEWERQRQEEKFARMQEFGLQLPKLRKQVAKDLRKKSWKKSKVIALMAEILDETGIRIGTKQYEISNQTYGLTTLRRKHLVQDGGILKFQYKGKSNQVREVTIEDKSLRRYIKKVAELPGYEIFRYLDEQGKSRSLDSDDVNEYLATFIGDGFSSKDFRTWVGSRLAIELFPEAVRVVAQSPRKKLESTLVRLVADELGNTPTICSGYYVHPVLLQKIEAKEIPVKNPIKESKSPYALTASEKLLMKLLEN